MPDFQDIKTFEGSGLDTDSDLRYVLKSDSDYRLNVVPTDSGSSYVLTNLQGNRLYVHEFTHDNAYSDAIYTCVGDCYDVKRNALYLLIASDHNNSSILRFNYDAKTFEKIVFDNLYIGLDPDTLLPDCFMIDDYLFFNPKQSSPRMVDVVWCTNYYDYSQFNVSGTYVAGSKFAYQGRIYECLVTGPTALQFVLDITGGTFTKVKLTGDSYYDPSAIEYFYNYPYQPEAPAYADFANDDTLSYNNLKGKVFQFAYNYTYYDNRESLYSPYSQVYGQTLGEGYRGDDAGDISVQNTLNIWATSSYSGSDISNRIKYINFIFRDSVSDGWGDWKLAGSLNIKDLITGQFYFPFRNDKSYTSVDNDIVSQPHQSLPIASRSQWSLNGERVVYGGNTDGVKIVDPDVDLAEVFVETTIDQSLGTAVEYNYTVVEQTSTEYYGQDTITYYDYVVTIDALGTIGGGETFVYSSNGHKLYLTIDGGWSLSQYLQAIANMINVSSVGEYASVDGVNGIVVTCGIYQKTILCTVYSPSSGIYTRQYGFKSGATHKFCLFYYDSLMRRSSAVTDKSMTIYLPFITEHTITQVSAIYNQAVEFTINHLPPDGAKYWSIGYSGNTSISDFWQYTISSIAVGTIDHTGQTAININSLQNHKTVSNLTANSFPNSNIQIYDFQEGDRIRFIMDDDGSTGFTYPLTTLYDYEIKDYSDDGTDAIIYIDEITTFPIHNHAIVEIYRPIKETTETVFYQTGDIYGIYTDTGVNYHTGLAQNQTSSVPAKLNITRGDIYYITRLFSEAVTGEGTNLYPVESFSYSDFANTKVWGQGKPGVKTGIGQTEDNTLRYSNKFINTSGINGISEFNGLDVVALSSVNGKINAIRQIGYMMNVYMERNVASIPVARSEQYTQDGINQLWKSDQVLGEPNYSPYMFGTVNPESVKLVDNYVYFFDLYRGSYIRDAINGMVQISGKRLGQADYKMETYFKNKAKALLLSGTDNIQVITAWDEEHGLVLVTFKDTVTASNNDTIGFHEGTNRWVSFYEVEGKEPEYVATDFVPANININSVVASDQIEGLGIANYVYFTNSGTSTDVLVSWRILDSGDSEVSSGTETLSIPYGYSELSFASIPCPVAGVNYLLQVSIPAGPWVSSLRFESISDIVTLNSVSATDGYEYQPLTNTLSVTNTGGAGDSIFFWYIFEGTRYVSSGTQTINCANGTHDVSITNAINPLFYPGVTYTLQVRIGTVGAWITDTFLTNPALTISDVIVIDGKTGASLENYIYVSAIYARLYTLYWSLKDSGSSEISSGNRAFVIYSGTSTLSIPITAPAAGTNYTLDVRLGTGGTDVTSNAFDAVDVPSINTFVTADGKEGTVINNTINVTNLGATGNYDVYWKTVQFGLTLDSGTQSISIPNGTGNIVVTDANYPAYSQPTPYEFQVRIGSAGTFTTDQFYVTDTWWLPSRDEFQAIYDNLILRGLGGFASAIYWLSTESDASNAQTFTVSTNTVYYGAKSATYRVRAVHSFTSSAYSLGDIGLSGGYIFYIDGTTCYEAAPSDQSAGKLWSNVGGTAIGATARYTAIGTGDDNTTAIIAQATHADSAAKVCNDLIL